MENVCRMENVHSVREAMQRERYYNMDLVRIGYSMDLYAVACSLFTINGSRAVALSRVGHCVGCVGYSACMHRDVARIQEELAMTALKRLLKLNVHVVDPYRAVTNAICNGMFQCVVLLHTSGKFDVPWEIAAACDRLSRDVKNRRFPLKELLGSWESIMTGCGIYKRNRNSLVLSVSNK